MVRGVETTSGRAEEAASVAVAIGLAIVVASLLREPAVATTDARPQLELDPAAAARGGQLEGVDRQ